MMAFQSSCAVRCFCRYPVVASIMGYGSGRSAAEHDVDLSFHASYKRHIGRQTHLRLRVRLATHLRRTCVTLWKLLSVLRRLFFTQSSMQELDLSPTMDRQIPLTRSRFPCDLQRKVLNPKDHSIVI
jgi:hypothetical protein